MFRLKLLVLFITIFSVNSISAQYTDLINSNRPGESMSAFSVGKTILQAEAGLYKIKENDPFLKYSIPGYGGDLVLRYGFLMEQLEFIGGIQYQTDKYTSQFLNENRSGIRKLNLGAKYLLYDPYKNYEEKIDIYSYAANHKFKWKSLVPAVSLYAGMNFSSINSPFNAYQDKSVSPKVMLITQNQFPGSNVFVTNIFYDKFGSSNPNLGYVVTYTKGFNDHWSAFLENKGVTSKLYKDMFVTTGIAYLFDKSMQVDASITTNIKDTPSLVFGGIGISWRFDKNYKEVRIKNTDRLKKDKNEKEKATVKKRLDEVKTTQKQ